MFLLAFKINKTKFHSEKENKSGENKFTNRQKPSFYLAIGSLFARIIGRSKVHKNHEKNKQNINNLISSCLLQKCDELAEKQKPRAR